MEINEIIKNNVQVSDMNLLISKGLYENDDYTDKFYKLYMNYHILLDKYLVRKFSLDSYDKFFDKARLRFMPVKDEDKDYYQYISGMDLNYIYLRNDIYVEKLSAEDIDEILNLSNNFIEYPKEETFELIERTYHDVIDISNETGDTFMCCYGPDSDDYWFPSNELVIGFRHDDFADNGLGEGELWEENNIRQIVFINGFLDDIRKNTAKITQEQVNYVWYNDYTIKEPVFSR